MALQPIHQPYDPEPIGQPEQSMGDLDDLGQAARSSQTSSYSRPATRPRRAASSEESPFLRGLMLSIGASPMVFIVVLLALFTFREILRAEVRADIEQAREKLQQNLDSARERSSRSVFQP